MAEDLPIWKNALRLLRTLESLDDDAPTRTHKIDVARTFFQTCGVDRLAKLARLLTPEMTAQQLLCVLVPVERVAARERITDAAMQLTSRDTPEAKAETFPLIIVADNMRSAVNIGGVFRTAEFLGAQAVWLCGYTATPDHTHVARSAMGTESMMPWRTFDNIRDAIAELRTLNTSIYALETSEQAIEVSACPYTFPAALLLGNERFGLDPEVLSLSDATIAISGSGIKNSINVVSAFAIAAYAIRNAYVIRDV